MSARDLRQQLHVIQVLIKHMVGPEEIMTQRCADGQWRADDEAHR